MLVICLRAEKQMRQMNVTFAFCLYVLYIYICFLVELSARLFFSSVSRCSSVLCHFVSIFVAKLCCYHDLFFFFISLFVLNRFSTVVFFAIDFFPPFRNNNNNNESSVFRYSVCAFKPPRQFQSCNMRERENFEVKA